MLNCWEIKELKFEAPLALVPQASQKSAENQDYQDNLTRESCPKMRCLRDFEQMLFWACAEGVFSLYGGWHIGFLPGNYDFFAIGIAIAARPS